MFVGVNLIKQENEVLSAHIISAYQISLIEKINEDKFEFKDIEHKFIFESVKKECSICKIEEKNFKIFKIFSLFFLVLESSYFEYDGEKTFCSQDDEKNYFIKNLSKYFSNKKELDENNFELDKNFIYYIIKGKNNGLNDEQISILLRGSKTLKILSENRYTSNDIDVVFAESGFLMLSNSKFGIDDKKAERFILLFLIGLAYNINTQKFIEKTINTVSDPDKAKKVKELEKIRDDFCIYSIKSFFLNPVKQEKHQCYEIWEFIERNYHVRKFYNEAKKQVSELTLLIRGDLDKKFEHKMITLGIFVTVIVAICSFFAGKYL